MFDWVCVAAYSQEVTGAVEDLFSREMITLEHKVSQYSEVLESGKREGEYKGIKITLYPDGKVRFRLSLHKLYNELEDIVNYAGKAMNHDTFTLGKLEKVFDWLYRTFQIDPDNSYLHQLEFGFNLANLSLLTGLILQQLICHKWNRFNKMSVVGKGQGVEVEYAQYKLKVYDKAMQYELPSRILRLEFKAKKMAPVYGLFGVNAIQLSALLDPGIWLNCKERIIESLHFCIFGDDFEIDLNAKDEIKLKEWLNPLSWETMNAKKRCEQKKYFDEFINEKGRFHIKRMLIQGVEKEFGRMLSKDDPFSGMNLPIKYG